MEMLDPATPATPGCVWIPTGELHPTVRTFGKYPNIRDWLPGDIVLVGAMKPDWIARTIIKVQAQQYGSVHGRWQHAAIYMGNGFVAEATTHGVTYSPIEKYVSEHFLRVRRNPALTPDQRWLVAIEAGVRLRTAYGFSDILSIYRSSFPKLKRQLRPKFMVQTNAVICAQLCQEAHATVTSQLLVPFGSSPAVPAALSQTAKLVDVALYWCSIG
jgi:hypothetical protein